MFARIILFLPTLPIFPLAHRGFPKAKSCFGNDRVYSFFHLLSIACFHPLADGFITVNWRSLCLVSACF